MNENDENVIDENRIREIKARRAEQMEMIERFVTGALSLEGFAAFAELSPEDVNQLRLIQSRLSARSGTSPSDAGR